MSIERTPYDRIAFKAVHNSVDRRWSITDQLAGTGLVEPCRGLELDLVQADDSFQWRVQHGVGDDGPRLETVLDEIVIWSNANTGHPVVTIHLDLKNAPLAHDGFARAIDSLLLSRFAGKLLTPAVVIGGHEDLVRGARAGGWPTFGALRGHFVFCLSGSAERKAEYAAFEPKQRICFADQPGSRSIPKTGDRVFGNLFCEAAGYGDSLRRYRAVRGFIARGYNIVRRSAWDLSVREGANLLSTDILANTSFSLGGDGYRAIDP